MKKTIMFRHKGIFSMLLAFVLSVQFIAPAFAEVGESNTIYINSAADLVTLSKNCNLDSWSQNKTVILNCDVNLAKTDFAAIPTFGGVFDGQGYTISGLKLDGYGSPQGLFRYVQENALIKKLTVRGNVTPSGVKSIIGGIAGKNSGTIQGCTFIGSINGSKSVGGIVGINEATGMISNCAADGIIYGEHSVGGIAGENFGTIILCSNRAGINTTIADDALDASGLESLSADSLLSISTSDIVDITDIGGVAGISGGIIQSCTNNGVIGYPHVGYNVGGIVGRQSGYLNSCTNNGSVNGRKDVGGICGQIEPFTVWRFSENSLDSLRTELNTLQDLIDVAIADSKSNANAISDQLEITNNYIDNATNAGDSLADQTGDLINNNLDVVNDISARVTQTIEGLEPITAAMSDAVDEMTAATDEFSKALRELGNTSEHLGDGFDEISPALDEIETALTGIQRAIKNLNNAVAAIKNGLGDSVAVEAAIRNMQEATSEFISYLRGISTNLSQILNAADRLTGSTVWQQNKPEIKEGINDLITAANDMAAAIDSISSAMSALNGNIDSENLSAALKSLNSAISSLSSAAQKANDGFAKAADGLTNIAGSYQENDVTTNAWQNVEDGMNMINSAIGNGSNVDFNAAREGLAKVNSGLNTIRDNLEPDALNNGLDKISDGVRDLSNATSELEAAQTELQNALEKVQNSNGKTEKTEQDIDKLTVGFSSLAIASQHAADSLLKINTSLNNIMQSAEFSAFEQTVKNSIRQISDCLTAALDAASAINLEARRLTAQIDLTQLSYSLDYLQVSGDEFAAAIGNTRDAVTTLKNTKPYFDAAADSAENALDYLAEASRNLKKASAALGDSVDSIHDLVGDLADKPEISFTRISSDYMAAQDQLNDSLSGITNSLSSLNNVINNSSTKLTDDLQAVSNQLFVVFDILIGTIEDFSALSINIDDHTEDISDQDVDDSETGGKVAYCINRGIIEGDINVGGVSGAMAVEYDFDLEDDQNLSEKISGSAKYLLRAVISGCENYSSVAAKKNCSGGIVGLMDFGYVNLSTDNGIITSSDGDYVGGIAGKSAGSIKNCYAKSRLSGKDYIGGIAGFAHNLDNCCSLIEIDGSNEFVGAIAGDSDGTISNNFFASDSLGAINGVSYSGKAEPIEYQQLLALPDLPDAFQHFYLTFVADDVEIDKVHFNYGGNIAVKNLPEIPQKDGCYAEWACKSFENLTFDAVVNAVYTKYLLVLSGEQQRKINDENSSKSTGSIVLVEGQFKEGDILETTEYKGITPEQTDEAFSLSIPNDGQEYHAVHFLPLKDREVLSIKVLSGVEWIDVETRSFGGYLVFDAQGNDVVFAVSYVDDSLLFYIIFSAAVLLLIIVIIIIVVLKYHNKNNEIHRKKLKKQNEKA